MDNIIVNIESIAKSADEISNSVHTITAHQWWNVPLFTSLVSTFMAVFITLFVGEMRDYLKNRKKVLKKFYLHFVENRNIDSIIQIAQITKYGGTSTSNGITTIIPEKNMSEKVLIEFKKMYKYWNLPHSRLRSLLKKCQKSIKLLPDKPLHELKNTSEYTNMQNIFDKIVKLSENKTGEDVWSI